MANKDRKVFNELLENYVGLGESANTVVRQLMKMRSLDIRAKLVRELRNLDKKRLELLDELDDLAKLFRTGP